VRNAFEYEQFLVLGRGTLDDLVSVPVRAEGSLLVARDDQEWLVEQFLGEVEGVPPHGGGAVCSLEEDATVLGLAAVGPVVLERLDDVDISDLLRAFGLRRVVAPRRRELGLSR
jgi:hypothetical protein